MIYVQLLYSVVAKNKDFSSPSKYCISFWWHL